MSIWKNTSASADRLKRLSKKWSFFCQKQESIIPQGTVVNFDPNFVEVPNKKKLGVGNLQNI